MNGSAVHVMPADFPRLPHVQFSLDQVVIPDKLWLGRPIPHGGRSKNVVAESFVASKESVKVQIGRSLHRVGTGNKKGIPDVWPRESDIGVSTDDDPVGIRVRCFNGAYDSHPEPLLFVTDSEFTTPLREYLLGSL